MQFSPIGFLISAALLLLGYGMGAPLLVGLMGSLAFGATALVTLHRAPVAGPDAIGEQTRQADAGIASARERKAGVSG